MPHLSHWISLSFEGILNDCTSGVADESYLVERLPSNLSVDCFERFDSGSAGALSACFRFAILPRSAIPIIANHINDRHYVQGVGGNGRRVRSDEPITTDTEHGQKRSTLLDTLLRVES